MPTGFPPPIDNPQVYSTKEVTDLFLRGLAIDLPIYQLREENHACDGTARSSPESLLVGNRSQADDIGSTFSRKAEASQLGMTQLPEFILVCLPPRLLPPTYTQKILAVTL